MDKEKLFAQIKGGLIVSCQALETEPLYTKEGGVMPLMAKAAAMSGAVGIRANTVRDITQIKAVVDLPVIGIIKKVYEDHPDVYITPTMAEIDALAAAGVEVIALDATKRTRPLGKSLDELFAEARTKYPDQLFMADCSSIQEGLHAAEIGFDLIGTTMASYTPYTAGCQLPPYDMITTLVEQSGKPVVAEGNLTTPEELRKAMDLGAMTAVVGSAITRPMLITKRFVAALEK